MVEKKLHYDFLITLCDRHFLNVLFIYLTRTRDLQHTGLIGKKIAVPYQTAHVFSLDSQTELD